MRLGLQVGRDITVAELAADHDAVIYAVGASEPRELGVPGEDLPGSLAATAVVGWYNGHPEIPPSAVDLSTRRVVVVGTGNVALDVARILTADPSDLAGSSIAGPALELLRDSSVREVLVLGRRGPESAAYTRPELLALTRRAGVELVVDDSDPRTGRVIDSALPGQHAALLQGVRREAVDWSAPVGAGPKRLILRFHSTPVAIIGDHRVRGVRVAGRDGEVEIPAGLVIRAVGQPAARAAVRPGDRHHPERARWVVGMPGTYVAGWIKRGSSDGIGANRTCAAETVGALLDDALAGRLPARSSRAGSLPLLRRLAGPERPERRSQTWHFQA